MAITTSPGTRAAAIGVASAALLVGAFAIGTTRSGGSQPAAAATFTSAQPANGRITVTGTGTVTGVPNQIMLSMGVQVTGGSVTSALSEANAGIRNVTRALRDRGVAQSDIQTSGLNIWPNYGSNGQINGYGVSESLTATLNRLSLAGGQIQAAVRAGGNTVTVDGVSLNLTNTGPLMATARSNALADAKAQAEQFARALGEPLGPVISISTPQASEPLPIFGANTPSASGAAAVPIHPGTQQLSVSITVVYGI